MLLKTAKVIALGIAVSSFSGTCISPVVVFSNTANNKRSNSLLQKRKYAFNFGRGGKAIYTIQAKLHACNTIIEADLKVLQLYPHPLGKGVSTVYLGLAYEVSKALGYSQKGPGAVFFDDDGKRMLESDIIVHMCKLEVKLNAYSGHLIRHILHFQTFAYCNDVARSRFLPYQGRFTTLQYNILSDVAFNIGVMNDYLLTLNFTNNVETFYFIKILTTITLATQQLDRLLGEDLHSYCNSTGFNTGTPFLDEIGLDSNCLEYKRVLFTLNHDLLTLLLGSSHYNSLSCNLYIAKILNAIPIINKSSDMGLLITEADRSFMSDDYYKRLLYYYLNLKAS